MEFPIELQLNTPISATVVDGSKKKTITIRSGVTTLLGPNGSGKTQLLRTLKDMLHPHVQQKKIRYISAGRLGPLENFRSNYDGQRGRVNYDAATFGDKSSLKSRHQAETVLGDFKTLAECPDILIKVQERLKKLFKREIYIEWDGGSLKVNYNRIDSSEKVYSSSREASGLLHLTAILAAIYDNDVGAILIDEPEVSMHPQLQSFVLQEINKVAGNPECFGKKLFIIATHSPEFIELNSVENLSSFVFCKDMLEPPLQIDPDTEELKNKKIQAFLFSMSQEHKLALFCQAPLLVEGFSDQVICSSISKKLSLNIEAAGSQILPVTGKKRFPVVIKLMRLMGKQPVIMADADAFTDSLDIITSFTLLEKANLIATTELGQSSAHQFAKNVYDDFVNLVNSNWDDLTHLTNENLYWTHRDRDKDNDEKLAKRRAAFCCLMSLSEEKTNKLDNSSKWLAIRNRILKLLELLEKVGCFILKSGTIEAYYQHTNQISLNEKPNAASHESTYIFSANDSDIKAHYNDIIKAIKYASNVTEINEAEAIREIVLAITAPTLAMINESTTDVQLQSSSRNILGVKADLFKLTKKKENDDMYLMVDLATSILDVKGFPLQIKKGSNPIEEVNRQMKLQ